MAKGVSKLGELIDLGLKAGLVEKSGPGFPMTGSASVKAAKIPRTFLRDNPPLMQKIRGDDSPKCPRRGWDDAGRAGRR